MTESSASVSPSVAALPTAPAFAMLGDADAESCVGDVCVIPAHHEQAVINRLVDSDRV
ncbi:hypothetical protein [Galbitalea soli]|uniref:Uncharacterized protein n=1 Tax=Galbitalea soli TaxID=1268042 RepID=A0A7C9PLL6_9MICO|nr:hypothetical protein [Galbitalea soli]NEM90352.1 hypothetical protein [Galbitalea soli]NYJ31062.1 hypothetical protein [Galbitalea soli]